MSVLEKVLQLEPINFRYTKRIDPHQSLRAGFSAQQVQQIFPDAVFESDGVLMLNVDVLEEYINEAFREAQLK